MPNPDPVILVIEDEASIRRFLRTALTNHGYQFVEAATAKDGLAAATQPESDGHDAQQVHAHGNGAIRADILRRFRATLQ